jgi:hypothetical protein
VIKTLIQMATQALITKAIMAFWRRSVWGSVFLALPAVAKRYSKRGANFSFNASVVSTILRHFLQQWCLQHSAVFCFAKAAGVLARPGRKPSYAADPWR